MLRIENICKSYGNLKALRGISLQVKSGETMALVGPSGCGKSTLMRLMVGLLQPDEGDIWFQGKRLTVQTSSTMRLKMGYVIQRGGLFPHLTAQENATLMAQHLGWNTKRITQQLHRLVTLTHFPSNRLKHYPAQLSGGQRQRISLMRALMLDPDLLLLDEPLGAVDPLTRSRLQQQLRNLIRDLGKTVILVTHDMAEAEFFSDCTVLMKQGRIVQQGNMKDLLQSPKQTFVTDFIRSQPTASFSSQLESA
ncbi:MAG: ATP-binding cassette domain-containing protein [Myxococcota bacterium]